jgi:hypothetical protein
MSHARLTAFALAATLASTGACLGDGAGPGSVTPYGTYSLESTSGRGPAAGTVRLSPPARAERRVRYALANGSLSTEYVATGTFRVAGDGTVDLRLREDDGRSAYVWRPRTNLTGAVLRLRHPDPADGPDIVESYRRDD